MTLLEKINHLNLKPRNAPAGVKTSTFGEWLRKLRAGQDIGEIPAALLTLYCDGRMNESGGLKLGSAEIFSEPRPNSLSKEFIQRMRGEFVPVAEPVLPPIISKSATEKLLAENNASDGPKFNASYRNIEMDLSKIQAKTKNMKKELPVVTALKDFCETLDCGSKDSLDKLNKFVEASKPDLPSATPTNFASWGTNGTMKLVGKIMKFNLNDLSYTIDFEKAKSGFLVDGKKYLLSDFTEVK